MTTAFLFPGQGSQLLGMLHRLPKHHVVATTIIEASTVLHADVSHLDTAKALESTISVQLATIIAGVSMARLLIHEGGKPSYVAGHSVGAFGAAVVSGALSFQDALLLVKIRAGLMEQYFPSGYGMGVIAGLGLQQVQQLINQAVKQGEQVFLANINGREQVTVTGNSSGIQLVLRAAKRLGVRRAEILKVAVPSHCPLLEPIAFQLEEAAKKADWKEPCVPYIANATARLLYTADKIREDLITSMSNPVRWHDMTTQLFERGTRLFIEMPPGQVLSSLAALSFPSVRSLSSHNLDVESLLYMMDKL